MKASQYFLNIFVTAFLAGACFVGAVQADAAKIPELLEQLSQPDLSEWQEVEVKIWEEWSRSGSAAMDVLLHRGRTALREGDTLKAIEHLSALTDHAPDFAEGWNARASAFYAIEEYGLSIADLQRALALNPYHFGALQGLGRIFEELDREEDALAAYRQVAAIHPQFKGLKEAIERLEKAVSGQEI